jgi:hypothetical protein
MLQKLQIVMLISVLMSLSITASPVPDLQTWHSDEGQDTHRFIIEAKGEFRLGFVRSMNYGLSEWYDLKFDPEAKNNLTRRDLGEKANGFQGALFNQVINPYDVIAHIGLAGTRFKDEPRSFTVIENTPRRVIVEASYFPMLSAIVTKDFKLTTRYVIYPTGRIYIHNTMTFLKDYTLTTWRHATVSLGDPQHYAYGTKEEGLVEIIAVNTLRNSKATWKPGSLKNMLLLQPKWNTWLILDNTETELTLAKKIGGKDSLKSGSYQIGSHETIYGWLRGNNNTNPASWSKDESKYCFTYWDKTTPSPFSDYARASVLLVPSPDNPIKGTSLLHSWLGFKRHYFGGDFKIRRKKGEKIHQNYLIQIGEENSGLLPDIRSKEVGAVYAESYLNPQAGLSFDRLDGAYLVDLNTDIEIPVLGHHPKPVLICRNSKNPPAIYKQGQLLISGTDYLLIQIDQSYLIQCLEDWNTGDIYKIQAK